MINSYNVLVRDCFLPYSFIWNVCLNVTPTKSKKSFFSSSTFLCRTMKNECNSFGKPSARSNVLLFHPRSSSENGFLSRTGTAFNFARTTAFVFCAALFCKIQAEESQPRLQRKTLLFLFHDSKQINSKTCVCTSYIITGSKIKNVIFSYCNISFSTNSVSNLILKACAFDPLKARNLHFAVEL